MKILEMSPLTELMRCFRGRRRELTNSRTHIDEEICLDAYEQIGGEAIDLNREIEAEAHKAEVYDLEAMKRITEAQAPDSEGGSAITPNEAKRFIPFISKSAELDHTIGGKAKVDAL